MNCIHVEFEVPGNNFLSAGSAGSEADRRPVHAAQHRARETRNR